LSWAVVHAGLAHFCSRGAAAGGGAAAITPPAAPARAQQPTLTRNRACRRTARAQPHAARPHAAGTAPRSRARGKQRRRAAPGRPGNGGASTEPKEGWGRWRSVGHAGGTDPTADRPLSAPAPAQRSAAACVRSACVAPAQIHAATQQSTAAPQHEPASQICAAPAHTHTRGTCAPPVAHPLTSDAADAAATTTARILLPTASASAWSARVVCVSVDDGHQARVGRAVRKHGQGAPLLRAMMSVMTWHERARWALCVRSRPRVCVRVCAWVRVCAQAPRRRCVCAPGGRSAGRGALRACSAHTRKRTHTHTHAQPCASVSARACVRAHAREGRTRRSSSRPVASVARTSARPMCLRDTQALRCARSLAASPRRSAQPTLRARARCRVGAPAVHAARRVLADHQRLGGEPRAHVLCRCAVVGARACVAAPSLEFSAAAAKAHAHTEQTRL
jgi:hypothetical protein